MLLEHRVGPRVHLLHHHVVAPEVGEVLQHALGVTHDGHLDRDVLADLGRVDVDVNHACVRREAAQTASGAVVEARADVDQQVALLQRAVDLAVAVHAHHAERQRVELRHRAEPEQRVDHRDAGLLRRDRFRLVQDLRACAKIVHHHHRQRGAAVIVRGDDRDAGDRRILGLHRSGICT